MNYLSLALLLIAALEIGSWFFDSELKRGSYSTGQAADMIDNDRDGTIDNEWRERWPDEMCRYDSKTDKMEVVRDPYRPADDAPGLPDSPYKR